MTLRRTTTLPRGTGWPPCSPPSAARASLDELDGWLPAWAGAHLRGHDEMTARFRDYPAAVAAAGALGADLAFDLQLIAPRLPPFPVPAGHGDEMAYRVSSATPVWRAATARARQPPRTPTR